MTVPSCLMPGLCTLCSDAGLLTEGRAGTAATAHHRAGGGEHGSFSCVLERTHLAGRAAAGWRGWLVFGRRPLQAGQQMCWAWELLTACRQGSRHVQGVQNHLLSVQASWWEAGCMLLLALVACKQQGGAETSCAPPSCSETWIRMEDGSKVYQAKRLVNAGTMRSVAHACFCNCPASRPLVSHAADLYQCKLGSD